MYDRFELISVKVMKIRVRIFFVFVFAYECLIAPALFVERAILFPLMAFAS